MGIVYQENTLPNVEACVMWAAQQGYCFAERAADEYGRGARRRMVEDDNTAMYNTRTWIDYAW